MKYLPALAILLSTTVVDAHETSTQATKAESAIEDCSKQVWPNFSPSCLKNADQAVNVRFVGTRR